MKRFALLRPMLVIALAVGLGAPVRLGALTERIEVTCGRVTAADPGPTCYMKQRRCLPLALVCLPLGTRLRRTLA